MGEALRVRVISAPLLLALERSGTKDYKLAVILLNTIACEVYHKVHKAMTWRRQTFTDGVNYVFLHEGLTSDYTSESRRCGRTIDGPEGYGFFRLMK